MVEKRKIIPTVGVLIYTEGKKNVLLVRHGEKASHLTGSYGIPAGRKEENESEVETAIRELKEETGLVAKVGDLRPLNKMWIADIQRKDGSTKTFSLRVFVCDKYSGELTETEETIPEFVPIENLDKYTFVGNNKEVIRYGLKHG